MDIFWANANGFFFPSSQRVEVLVHDGASDFRLWPGFGQDRNLLERLRWRFVDGRCGERDKLGAQRGERRIDDRIAEQHTLRLKAGDSGFELLPFRGRHRYEDTNCVPPAVNLD